MKGASRLTRRMIFTAFTGIISVNRALTRSAVRRRRWLFPPLVRTTIPDPVMRNRFEVALWVLSLTFPSFTFLATAKLLRKKWRRLLSQLQINNTCIQKETFQKITRFWQSQVFWLVRLVWFQPLAFSCRAWRVRAPWSSLYLQ